VDEPAPSGVRRRTRRAILDAALFVWARDWSASLGDIADRAAVSRSTLHRYFTDRQALVEAAKESAIGALTASGADALQRCATAHQELDALLRSTVEVGDAVIFLFSDPNRFAELWDDDTDQHADLRAIIIRAQSDGAIADDLEPDWVINVFYALIYAAAESVNNDTLPRHRAGEIAARTFFGGVTSTT
jgi:AcrR family transcriptional regulator